MGYQVISFAYDDVEQRPELCVTLLRLALSRYQILDAPRDRLLIAEKEIMRLVVRNAGIIRPKEVADYFTLDPKTVRMMLKSLCEKGWLAPIKRGIGVKNVEYKLARDVLYCWD